MTGFTLSPSRESSQADGLRPVNLQTDLNDLADLIETAFSGSMDSGGRAAIREMRQLSRLGMGLGVLSRLNDLAQGMSLGYVWVDGGRIVGNVSVYPTDVPGDHPKTWIIANVAVYPSYRGRGIAGQLMDASLQMIRKRGRGRAVLQVDLDNEIARHLYRKRGFVEERAWTHWRRSGYRPLHVSGSSDMRIVARRLGDSPHEYALAKRVRPQRHGGVDWLTPSHPNTFRLSLPKRIGNWLNLRDIQRLVIRGADERRLRGWLQVETSFGMSHKQLTLMALPEHREQIVTRVTGNGGSAVRAGGFGD